VADAIAKGIIDIGVKGSKSVDKVLKSTRELRQVIKDLNSTPITLNKLLAGEGTKAQQVVRAVTTEINNYTRAVVNGTKALSNNEASLVRQGSAFSRVAANAKIGSVQYVNAVQAQEKAEQKLRLAQFERLKAQQQLYGLGRMETTESFKGIPELLKFSSQVPNTIAALSAYRSELRTVYELVDRGSSHYAELEEAIKKVDKELGKPRKISNIKGGQGGLAGREQALKEALRIQNQLETGSDAHIKSIVGVRKAQQAYNQELRVSKTIQSALNLDLIIWKRLLDSVPALMGRIAGGMKGLFLGKFGKLGQAAGIIGVSDAVQRLIKIIPGLNQAWKKNIETTALWVQRVTEGITGVTVAYTALSGLLGGAQWVVGAIAGFVQFEAAASKVVWSIEGNMTKAFSLFGRLARELPQLAQAIATTMPQALGGMGVKGSFLDYMGDGSATGTIADALGGGKGRKEARRYTRQGPTELQNAQKDLNQINKMLEQRNTTSKGYTELLQKQIQAKVKIKELQKGINQFVDKTLQNEIAAGNVYAKDAYPQEYLEHINKSKEALKDLNKLETKNRDQQRQDADKLIKDRGQARFDEVKRRWQLEATGHKNEMKRIKERQAAERQRTAARNKAWSRFGENVMLGAGFPMLFGGGPGAVAGGLTGAIGQSAMGSQGFGMQILFSALGQQIDAFVGKTAELGKAFNKINPNVDAVIGSLGEVNTEYGKHLEMLKKIKGDAAAMVEATRRLTEIIGEGGVAAMEKFGNDSTKLGNEWKKMTTLMMSSIAELINSSGILLALTTKISRSNRYKMFKNRIDDLGGENLRGLSQDQLKMLELNRLEGDIQSGRGYKSNKTWQRMTRNMTNMGVPFVERFSRTKNQQQDLVNVRNQIDILMRKILAKEGLGDLLGSGADKLASIQKEVDLLERSFAIGSKAAGQEQEAAEILKEQNESREKKLTLNETDILQQIQARDRLKEQLELWEQIKDTIATGLTSAIQGLIDGTKSLGESLASIAKSIGSMLLQSAISGWIAPIGLPKTPGGNPPGAAEGMYMANGIKPFASGGLATRPTLGLVGEAGEDEYIIPASKMASSMQRYSAGARGEAVIPGTGSSYAGGGAGGSTTVNYSGPILNFNSEEFVPKSAVGQIIATATSQGAKAGEGRTLATLRNSRSARSRLGM